MSIAVAVKKNDEIVMATDRQTIFGSSRVPFDNLTTEKIHEVGSALLATTGWGLYENILDDILARSKNLRLTNRTTIFRFFMRLWRELHDKYPFVRDQCDKDDDSPFGSLDSSFLIANQSGIYHVGSDMSVTYFEKYYAIGSGADYSLGALHSLYSRRLDAAGVASQAVEAAVAFDVHCGGDIDLRRVRSKK